MPDAVQPGQQGHDNIPACQADLLVPLFPRAIEANRGLMEQGCLVPCTGGSIFIKRVYLEQLVLFYTGPVRWNLPFANPGLHAPCSKDPEGTNEYFNRHPGL